MTSWQASMSELLFDTTILLDALDRSRPECVEAREVLSLCNGGGDLGLVCSGALKDVYHILGKMWDEPTARRCVSDLMGLLVIVPIGAEECDLAMRSGEPDFEDGIVRAAAELEGVDFILTRSKSAFQNSKVRSVTCAEYLRIVASEPTPRQLLFPEEDEKD